MFHKKTIKDIPIEGKNVLVRVDFNVPLEDNGDVADDYRIKKAIPTIKYLQQKNCKIALVSHLGRPKGKKDPKFSLKKVSIRLGELLDSSVGFVPDSIGPQVSVALQNMQPSSVMVLENTRFYKEETDNDSEFAKKLALPFDYIVQDAFGNVHRDHASMTGIANWKPVVAGLLVETEVSVIERALRSPKKPVVAVVGGAKIHTKLELLNNLIRVADTLVIGGAMANTFLKAQGYEIGKSLYEEDEIGPARTVMEAAKASQTELILPQIDVGVSKQIDASAKRVDKAIDHVDKDDIILDFGKQSMRHVLEIIDDAGTVLWNGPLGMTELPQFAEATKSLAHHMIDHHVDSIVGGGDTAGFVQEQGIVEKMTHVSTGGGASLELMAGKKLPAVEALLD